MAYITLNKAHLFHNLDCLSHKAGGKERVMAVLKDNAYGHGLELIARCVAEYGIKKVAVKNIAEANTIASLFDEVLVLVDHPDAKPLASSISLAIHSYDSLQKIHPSTAIHLALDTGMHRNGIGEEEIEKAIAYILENNLLLKGVFTHFRSADEVNSEFFWQRKRFHAAKERIQSLLPEHNIAFHACNSAGLLRCEDLSDEAYARCGIAMYGYSPLNPFFKTYDLKPVLALWAEKLSSRWLKKGERVGYGGVYEALEDEYISTYDIGYGDGFFRFDGHTPVVMADGEKSKGRMSMDSFCLGGDAKEVCLFKDASSLAKHFNTIPYEIVTKLSPALKRIII